MKPIETVAEAERRATFSLDDGRGGKSSKNRERAIRQSQFCVHDSEAHWPSAFRTQ